jgi:glyoxylase-like metal-dependent hydrolase (beta-lactamase superfamily II)
VDLPEVEDWFVAEDMGQGISRLHEPSVDPLIQGNVYLIRGESRDLVIDSGTGIAALRPFLPVMRAEPVAVATHAHYDHVGGLPEFTTRLVHEAEAGDLGRADPMAVLLSRFFPSVIQEFLGSAATECLVAAAPGPGFDPASFRQARSEPTGCLHDGDVIDLGDRRLEVLHLPGHSPGSICLLDTDARILFTGDVVYAGGLIDEVWPGTDRMSYIRSMRRLAEVGVSIAFPGHGDPLTTEQFQQIIDRYLQRHSPAG